MLEIEHVSFGYSKDSLAVNDVSLTLEAGEFLAIAGRNGSGKTTLTKLIMTLHKPGSGQIFFNGRNTRGLTPADMAKHVGYVFQNPDRQIFRDTVEQEIAYGPEQLGFSAEQTRQAVNQAMEAVGIAHLAKVYPRTLPKGQKQKVAIASALAMQPQMLILDEPTSGQDARAKEGLMQILKSLNQSGKTIILVTHDMDVMVRYARRVAVMDHGAKIFDGPIGEFFAAARSVMAWGLREPAAVKVSRGLASFGIPVTADVKVLSLAVTKRARGETYA